jgi:hypothetical protein
MAQFKLHHCASYTYFSECLHARRTILAYPVFLSQCCILHILTTRYTFSLVYIEDTQMEPITQYVLYPMIWCLSCVPHLWKDQPEYPSRCISVTFYTDVSL